MTAADLLLDWVSTLGLVREAKLRKACAELDRVFSVSRDGQDARQAFWRLTRALNRLGHVERDAMGLRAVAPHILRTSAGAVVVGARATCSWDGLTIHRSPQLPHWTPCLWKVEDTPALEAWCRDHGVGLVEDRGLDVLRTLPPVTEAVRKLPETERPLGDHERLDGRGKWSVQSPAEGGVYRRSRIRHAPLIVCLDGRFLRATTMEERWLVRWWNQRRHGEGRLRYDGRSALEIAGSSNLPCLVERCLIMATGELPTLHRRLAVYRGIDPDRAQEVARVLECPLS